MTRFSEFEYERIDPDDFQSQMEEALETFREADTTEERIEAIEVINDHRNRLNTMRTLAHVKHSIDTEDEFWEEEQAFYDQAGPTFSEFIDQYYQVLESEDDLGDLKDEFGPQLFRIADLKTNTFSPEVKDDLAEENRLSTEYQKLLASCRLEYKGEERNLSDFTPFLQSTDRDTRRSAAQTKWSFFDENNGELDEMFDDLVGLRDRIAGDLGYETFTELGYDRMCRSDYGREDVERLRNLVVEHVVPIAEELKEQQRKRLGVDDLMLYDEPCKFTDGNPNPKGEPDWILEQAENMYAECSPETDEFFQFMVENDLLDVKNKKGKAGGGYCTYFPDHGAPFIFSNFNGTSGDVRVLTHEGGHAFQKYQSRHFDVPEYRSPTSDAAEIHSMSMEFFTWPWMENFFEEDTEKFLFKHLSGAIRFLPYGCAVDEFQHRVYDNPECTPDERHEIWRELEDTYLPSRDGTGIPHVEKGGYWQSQRHIYRYPFYYIDYVVARICALQFWSRARQNREEAWNDYVDLCGLGGSHSFLELVDHAELSSPLSEGWVDTVLPEVRDWLRNSSFYDG
jgi:M3 family oligoendopeptidase